jgi:hypothetical protein
MDLNLHNRDLTQHNSYPLLLGVSIISVRALREGGQDGAALGGGIIVGCEEVLEGLH